jgi:hypothetical protein
MKRVVFFILTCVHAFPGPALADLLALPGHLPAEVQYLRTGKESAEKAEKAGLEELASGNPCLTPMKADLEKFASHFPLVEAAQEAARAWVSEKEPSPVLVLHATRGAMLLKLELRLDKKVVHTDAVSLTRKPGSWAERVKAGACAITEAQLTSLVDKVAEPGRLVKCKMRKLEIFDLVEKISAFERAYLPERWLREARDRLEKKEGAAPELLRADQKVYRTGNESFASCNQGLALLEKESSGSLRVLREIAAAKPQVDLPAQAMEALSRLLRAGAK